jgi:DNA-binding NtrC family response regulator
VNSARPVPRMATSAAAARRPARRWIIGRSGRRASLALRLRERAVAASLATTACRLSPNPASCRSEVRRLSLSNALSSWHLSPRTGCSAPAPRRCRHGAGAPDDSSPPGAARSSQPLSAEARRLLDALRRTGGNKKQAASLLGMSRVTLWRRLQEFGIADKVAGTENGA